MTAPDEVTATVQEVLARHWAIDTEDQVKCLARGCGWVGTTHLGHRAHVAAAVVAALGLTEEWGVRFDGRGPFFYAATSRDEAEEEADSVEDKHAPAVVVHRFVTAWTEAT